MSWEALVVTQWVAAALMFGVAAWLLWLKFQSPINRAFALFLALRGGSLVATRLALDGFGPGAAFWFAIREYVHLAIVPALVYFLLVYLRPRGLRAARAIVIVVAVAAEAFYLYDHCLDLCVTSSGARFGPLSLLTTSTALAYGIAGLVLAREAARLSGPRAEAAWLVGASLALNGLLDGAIYAAGFAWLGPAGLGQNFEPSVWVSATRVLLLLAIVPAIGACLVLLREAGTATGRFGAGTVVALLVGGLVGSIPPLPEALGPLANSLVGLMRALLPVLVAYALVRHRLFDIDVKLRWTIRRGTVAGAFLAAFLIATNVAQNYLGEEFGALLGGVSAGLLFFVLTPLQRFAERVAVFALPERTAAPLAKAERLALFRDQATLAWRDGSLTRRERELLDQLRDRLGITHEEASDLEGEAAKGPAGIVRS